MTSPGSEPKTPEGGRASEAGPPQQAGEAARPTAYAHGRRLSRFAIASLVLACIATWAPGLRDTAGGRFAPSDPAMNRIWLTFLEILAEPGRILAGLMGVLAAFQVLYMSRQLRGLVLALGGVGATVTSGNPVFPMAIAPVAVIMEAVFGMMRVSQPATQQAVAEPPPKGK